MVISVYTPSMVDLWIYTYRVECGRLAWRQDDEILEQVEQEEEEWWGRLGLIPTILWFVCAQDLIGEVGVRYVLSVLADLLRWHKIAHWFMHVLALQKVCRVQHQGFQLRYRPRNVGIKWSTRLHLYFNRYVTDFSNSCVTSQRFLFTTVWPLIFAAKWFQKVQAHHGY